MFALDRAMHTIVIKHVEHRFLLHFNRGALAATMQIEFLNSV